MRVLVTGANGFVARHICDYLIDKEYGVIGTDLYENNNRQISNYVQMDIASEGALEKAAESIGNVNAIVHCAAYLKNDDFSELLGSINIIGTQHILNLAQKISAKKIVLISSCPIIGTPQQHPITEDHSVNPATYYHLTKFFQEQLVDYANRKGIIQSITLRIPSPIGIGMNEATILPVFIKNALKNHPITLSGSGSREQNYVHVKDIAQAVYRSLTNENAMGVFNIASEKPMANIDLAKLCVSMFSSSSPITFSGAEDPNDYQRWDISIEKAKAHLGYSPIIGIAEAILEIAESYRKNREAR